MPRLAKSEVEKQNIILVSVIKRQMALYDKTPESLATSLGFDKRTLSNRFKYPEDFKLKEIRKLKTVLRIPLEELKEFL